MNPDPAAPPRASLSASARGYKVVSVLLPLAYLEILTKEAEIFGVKRSHLLDMLLKRKLGLLSFERAKQAPAYTFTEDNVLTSKQYVWYCKPDIRTLVDQDRVRMGNIPYAPWIIHLLNDWLGKPQGGAFTIKPARGKPRR